MKLEEENAELNNYKILPIPIIITEPAIGNGLGIALALFHPVKGGLGITPRATTPTSIAQIEKDRQAPPPVVTGVFGAYTSSKSKAVGIGHMNNWLEDHIRYKGALATAKINSTFYAGGLPVDYTLEGDLIYQDVKFRMADSSYFLGMSLSYLDATNTHSSNLLDDLPSVILESDIRNVGLAATGSYDTRDNTMNPNSGQLVDLSLWRYDDILGGNYTYWSMGLDALSFHRLHERYTLGFRLNVSAVDGKPPFYGYPWVKLRGIPAMRYQDEIAGAVEVELRYLVAPKWDVMGFAGLGFTEGDKLIFDNPVNIYSFGVGVRRKVIEKQNVWVGLDVARGPEEWNSYIQVGHAW